MHQQQQFFFELLAVLATSAAIVLAVATLRSSQVTVTAAQESETQGALQVLDASGKPKAICPLKHTSVKAEISGFISRVVVTQEFENPFKEKIEAVYTFPLPQNAAVDDMTMLVGDRTVRGRVLRREEAQAVYEAAKTGGKVASLLDQERPNIFTQSVANIMPGEQIKISISYVETLKYEDGSYEFVFPMVVGPRYIPGNATGSSVSSGNGFAPDTDSVPDASRITPRPVAKGMRVGHDISLEVALDAGVAIENVSSGSHAIDMQRPSVAQAQVRLKSSSVIPNKDFILRYDVAGKGISDALLTHRSEKGGFFTLILQPPDRVTVTDVTPKELDFVLDTSGSMNGFPIEKAKETMKLALDSLYPADTFNLITFAGDTHVLFPEPVPATLANLQKAQAFLASRSGSGGTEMMKAIRAALDPSDAQGHIRIVCFMTDGYVGNDMEIISEVKNHPNARVFSFGIGSSVNRFLLDKMAEQGRGEVEYVALNDDGSAAARRFHERVRNPLLTDISLEWNGLPVADVYPQRIPYLFGAKPVILSGRYTAAGNGVVRLKGKMSGRDFVRDIPVAFPEAKTQHDVLAPLWARSRIDDLMSQDFNGMQQDTMRPDLKETITGLGLEYRLMTQYTSFVAVEEMIVTDGGTPRRIDVPVEVPEGVSREGVFGDGDKAMGFMAGAPKSRRIVAYSNISPSVGQTVTVTSSGSDSKAKRESKKLGGGGSGGGVGVGTGRRGGVSAASSPRSLGGAVTLEEAAVDEAKLSPEEEKRQLLLAKFHPAVLAVIERLKINAKPGADEVRFIRGEKADVQIWLTDKSPEALAKLKELGFEVILDPKTAKLVIGRLPISNLEKLAELKFVRYVAPQVSS
ncbi:MAG: VIT and VWA domain-containing protein [Pyrinomonadaceae bacterium]|nr:VIT and VWA domain-containing protein [Pyrinomonadaceae bacterium]